MKVHELIDALESLGEPNANIVVYDCHDAMSCVVGTNGLYADPAGDLYVTLTLDEIIRFQFVEARKMEC